MTAYNDADHAGGIANAALYAMCQRWPTHTNVSQTADKLKLISRFYEVSRNLGGAYEAIANALADPDIGIDNQLKNLQNSSFPKCKDLVVKLHRDLDDVVCKQIPSPRPDKSGKRAGLEKRVQSRASFLSKYLHFHAPDAFPILDRHAEAALTKRSRLKDGEGALGRYEKFCLRLERSIGSPDLRGLTLRQIDQILLAEGRVRSSV